MSTTDVGVAESLAEAAAGGTADLPSATISGGAGGLGGSINERPVSGKANPKLALMLHAAYGIDHYPRFLAKWQDEALAELHAELQALTQHVAAARKDNAEVRRLASAATRGAPALGAFEKSIASGTLDGIVAPALLAALRARTAMAAQAALEDLLDEEAPGVRRSAVRRYSERRG